MTKIQTYVFIDLETTGLPKEEYNKTRITELSMVAVKRQHILDTRAGAVPRVQHKLTLCLNPRRLVSEGGAKITGLDNDLLEHEPIFDMQVFNMIDTFLSVLSQPVCLIAHNGLNFDYPILQNHLAKFKVNFSKDVLCADCLHCFYHILEKTIHTEGENSKKQQDLQLNSTVVAPSVLQSADESDLSKEINVDDSYYTSNISMQSVNETTPTGAKRINHFKGVSKGCKARKKLYPGPKSSQSNKLTNIYERVLNRPAGDPHRAENDCLYALEVSVALVKEFVEWVDKNHIKFSSVEPMQIGVPL